ncbi:hypothetical protein H7F35_27125 [Variovorax sp. PAMC26660]|nr:hypothetical protein H7F35_27125 [Variovorax sp. PAMC26660]
MGLFQIVVRGLQIELRAQQVAQLFGLRAFVRRNEDVEHVAHTLLGAEPGRNRLGDLRECQHQSQQLILAWKVEPSKYRVKELGHCSRVMLGHGAERLQHALTCECCDVKHWLHGNRNDASGSQIANVRCGALFAALPRRNCDSGTYRCNRTDCLNPSGHVQAPQHYSTSHEKPAYCWHAGKDRKRVHKQQAGQHCEAQQRAPAQKFLFHFSLHPGSGL